MTILALFFIDCIAIFVSAVGVFVLRDNLTLNIDRITMAWPYLAAALMASIPLLPLSGISKSVWRFTSFDDLLRIFVAATAIVACATMLAYVYNGLQDVPRSVPILHVLLFTGLAAGLRAMRRLRHARRRVRALARAPDTVLPQPERVLLVGVDPVAALFLRATREMTRGQVQVLGVLAAARRYRGRTFSGVPVLGSPDDIAQVLQQMKVHGADIQRIVISTPPNDLPPAMAEVLARLDANDGVSVEYLQERLGFVQPRPAPEGDSLLRRQAERLPTLSQMVAIVDLDRPYWRIKRLLDILGATVLLIATAPLMLCVALVVALDVGAPVMFWQERLGMMGKRLRINKFRTMRPAWTASGERIPEQARTSRIGALLRRTRLDELPHLYHILVGDMSFIGPRPLLYAEQELAYAARLAIRPGLTGWAQVHGGREVSVSDKVAMDLWYIRNASLRLDVRIALKTGLMLVRGDQPDADVISMAWRDVGLGSS